MLVPVVILSIPIVTLIIKFGSARAEVKELRKLLPLCAWCGKKIRDADGNWMHTEVYIKEQTGADISHGICPECAEEFFPREDSKENDGNKVS